MAATRPKAGEAGKRTGSRPASLALFWSDRFADHQPPHGHPESAERAAVMRAVVERWRAAGGTVVAPGPATREQLLRVHAAGYLDRLEASSGSKAVLDADTYMSPGSYDAALLAAGAMVGAVDHVLAARPPGEPRAGGAGVDAALALVRPPGHHAVRERAMGFCLLNNVAVAACHALAAGIERVAIVDYDVHHGNGTQWSFYADPRVLFISIHQYPHYPGTGAAGECGVGPGEGFTVNIPIAAGATDGDYEFAFDQVVEPVLDAFAPQLLIADVGFDAHERDPLANMRVTTAGFSRLASRMRAAAERCAGGRLIAAVEGGYNLEALDESLGATVDAFSGTAIRTEPRGERASAGPSTAGAAAVAAALAAQRRYWPTL